MADKWWARVRCPVCAGPLSAQHWGDSDYRITCECGYSFNSKNPFGMSDLILQRGNSTLKTTPGELSQDDRHLCWTLEPPHESDVEPICIPAGRYMIEMQWSTRFQMDTPHLVDVPGRSLIEIHQLNNEHLVTMPDGSKHWTTEGCIGPGLTRDIDWVSSSVSALHDVVIPAVKAVLALGPCFIQVIDAHG